MTVGSRLSIDACNMQLSWSLTGSGARRVSLPFLAPLGRDQLHCSRMHVDVVVNQKTVKSMGKCCWWWEPAQAGMLSRDPVGVSQEGPHGTSPEGSHGDSEGLQEVPCCKRGPPLQEGPHSASPGGRGVRQLDVCCVLPAACPSPAVPAPHLCHVLCLQG